MNRNLLIGLVALLALWSAALIADRASAASDDGKQFLLEEQPEGATDVLAVRKAAKDQQEVIAVGRIGGRKNPWVKGAAAFSIVDRSLTPCNEGEDSKCPTPWDYCCSPNLSKATVLVMVVDAQGKIVRQDARKLLGVKELDTVFVQARAKRDKSGNVTLLATKIFIPTEHRISAR